MDLRGVGFLTTFCLLILGTACVQSALAASNPVNVNGDWSPPHFCGERFCPEFKNLSKQHGFELRTYKHWKWAFTFVPPHHDHVKTVVIGVKDLIKYFRGGNDANVTLDITVPFLQYIPRPHPHPHPHPDDDSADAVVEQLMAGLEHATLDVEPGTMWRRAGRKACPDCQGKHSHPHPLHIPGIFAMPLPPSAQDEPPAPVLCNRIKIKTMPRISVATRSFGGYATPWKIRNNLIKLLHGVRASDSSIRIEPKGFYIASYSPPGQTKDRHTEVGVVVDLQTDGQDIEEF